jgi:hypothetical protein
LAPIALLPKHLSKILTENNFIKVCKDKGCCSC